MKSLSLHISLFALSLVLCAKPAEAVMDIIADASTALSTYQQKIIGIYTDYVGEESSIQSLKVLGADYDKAKEIAAKAEKHAKNAQKAIEAAQKAQKELQESNLLSNKKHQERGEKVQEDIDYAYEELARRAKEEYAAEQKSAEKNNDTAENENADETNSYEKQLSEGLLGSETVSSQRDGLILKEDGTLEYKESRSLNKNEKNTKELGSPVLIEDEKEGFVSSRKLDAGKNDVKINDISVDIEQKISKEALNSVTAIKNVTPITEMPVKVVPDLTAISQISPTTTIKGQSNEK